MAPAGRHAVFPSSQLEFSSTAYLVGIYVALLAQPGTGWVKSDVKLRVIIQFYKKETVGNEQETGISKRQPGRLVLTPVSI